MWTSLLYNWHLEKSYNMKPIIMIKILLYVYPLDHMTNESYTSLILKVDVFCLNESNLGIVG